MFAAPAPAPGVPSPAPAPGAPSPPEVAAPAAAPAPGADMVGEDEQSCGKHSGRAVVREALPKNLITRLPGADLKRRCGSGGPAPSDLLCAQAIRSESSTGAEVEELTPGKEASPAPSDISCAQAIRSESSTGVEEKELTPGKEASESF
uniref:Uncharacterized protein n=1 Tax=Oryza sativa subsp. japonica TaxID=39947 RepID=Q67VU8_ORYSJ|nr:hypothetical protein [Oryza sativa Japonica Group]BAD37721.1 hypothetical protein [Oryza sativa Japonica Group]